MSQEINFVNQLLLSGCTVELDCRKWGADSLLSIASTAKNSGATIILRNAMVLLRLNANDVTRLANTGGSSLHFDFSS